MLLKCCIFKVLMIPLLPKIMKCVIVCLPFKCSSRLQSLDVAGYHNRIHSKNYGPASSTKKGSVWFLMANDNHEEPFLSAWTLLNSRKYDFPLLCLCLLTIGIVRRCMTQIPRDLGLFKVIDLGQVHKSTVGQ